jgi:hypothetical protein
MMVMPRLQHRRKLVLYSVPVQRSWSAFNADAMFGNLSASSSCLVTPSIAVDEKYRMFSDRRTYCICGSLYYTGEVSKSFTSLYHVARDGVRDAIFGRTAHLGFGSGRPTAFETSYFEMS